MPKASLQSPAISAAPSSPEPLTPLVAVGAVRPWLLYLLECRGGKLYAGISPDVEARFAAHQAGNGAKFTRANPPLRILAAESHVSRAAASVAEYRLKQLSRDQKLNWAATRRWQTEVVVTPPRRRPAIRKPATPA